jgi:ATP-dependent helicase/nuclease subunit B
MGERVFLGWDSPFLPRAAGWLIERYRRGGPVDMGEVVLVLPGRRAARRLEELLAERAGPSWIPPRLTTEAGLASSLASETLGIANATELAQAWARAVIDLPQVDLERLAPAPPHPRSRAELRALAREVQRVALQLSAEGSSLAEVAARPDLPQRERWRVLAALEARCLALLAPRGRLDPARAALECARRGAIRRDRDVVLVACVELGAAQRELLAGARSVASLVFAPQDLSGGFDALGGLVPEFWASRDLPLDGGDWRVVEDADGAARDAVAWLAELASERELAPEDATFGALDPALVPFLRARLEQHGVAAHWAGGEPFAGSLPGRLLALTLELARSSRWDDFAALVRHPDLEEALRRRLPDALDLTAPLDRYFAEHLPFELDGRWLAGEAGSEVSCIDAALRALLGSLLSSDRRAPSQWAPLLRNLLIEVYPAIERPSDDPGLRSRAEALAALAAALEELESLAGTALDGEGVPASEALELVLERLERETFPAPAERGAIEILGWLELALDEAPQLFLAGWNEGALPQPLGAGPFLGDDLRGRLGLSAAERRLARDLWAASAICASRRVRAVSLRRDVEGEPARPSRLTFHCAAEEALARVRRFFVREAQPALGAGLHDAARAESKPVTKPPLGTLRGIDSLRVTDFKRILASPYLFYLQRVRGLEVVEDALRELDPLGFGILAHDVLEDFGKSSLRDSTEPQVIAAFLARRLDEEAELRFGGAALPAVAFQVRQLRRRFEGFSGWQARRNAEGWRIEHVEWEARGFQLDVDGQPIAVRGKIDRIERHTRSGEWCLLDYKTGDLGTAPEKTHRCGPKDARRWIDLQLPLYREMARPLWQGQAVWLGYLVLPRDPAQVRIQPAGWSPELCADALEVARDAVRSVRRREFAEPGERPPAERVFAALAGFDLLGLGPEPEESAEGTEAGVEAIWE